MVFTIRPHATFSLIIKHFHLKFTHANDFKALNFKKIKTNFSHENSWPYD